MGIARLYKAGTPFNASDLVGIDYAQTADVVYFAHITRLCAGGIPTGPFTK
jgi:hypothetical protein